MLLTWLPDVLRAGGCTVEEAPGWETRGGRGPFGPIKGILCHHTAGSLDPKVSCLPTIIHGRLGLSGPLAQLYLGRDGVFTVVAAGRANHAGLGQYRNITTGNTSLIGIEAENSGDLNRDPWDHHQVEEYAKGCAAICKHLGLPALMVGGHKEYALPKGRKCDPSFDMTWFRGKVVEYMHPTIQPTAPKAP